MTFFAGLCWLHLLLCYAKAERNVIELSVHWNHRILIYCRLQRSLLAFEVGGRRIHAFKIYKIK
ncbi:hypothetical protein M758_2G118400 [Ceratodon purpureus]|uniref:Secreted protein n=1 Tax=Ceratodon purpureus TaxID=3225 RepID=A0A8T0IWK8_CERPU|nr:hypothetical protein KC19_2G139600 [Ceratodon purpureus]KAG0626311.1 hypothetical protein M758_2G118400 [Ceratodon purpureus]